LRRFNGSFKGTIAECMFKLTNDRVVITKFFNKVKYFTVFGKHFTDEQKAFLETNWYSIDAIEVFFSDGQRNIILYEIKTKNKAYEKKIKWPHKITQNTVNMYRKSAEIGFKPIIVIVWFLENWNFEIEVREFESGWWTIDRPKLYDKN